MTWMRRSWTTRMVAAMLASLVVLGAVTALAAANAVPATRIGQSDHPVLLQQLVPGQCAGIAGSLSNLVVDSGSFDGTNAGDLILGSAGPDDIQGRQGNDCIVGGDGNDVLNGTGNDAAGAPPMTWTAVPGQTTGATATPGQTPRGAARRYSAFPNRILRPTRLRQRAFAAPSTHFTIDSSQDASGTRQVYYPTSRRVR
jgi:Ca2+-binding RTX toxin-like protein